MNILEKVLNKIHIAWFDLNMKRKNYVVKFDSITSRFFLPYYKNDYIQHTILKTKNYYERENLDFICKEWKEGIIGNIIQQSYVLDIGANIGNHSLYYLNECNAKGVYCFEPVKDTFRILEKNIVINKLSDRTTLNNVGVGVKTGQAKIGQYDINNIGSTTIELSKEGDIKVISIDELDIKGKIGLVKMDVEGFEISALQGMENTLRKNLPFISIEIRDYNKEEALSILTKFGYKYIELDKQDVYSDYLFYV